jgi:hypothetical protein
MPRRARLQVLPLRVIASLIGPSTPASVSPRSLQANNFPGRYLRHYAYELRIDPITTATARDAATFRVTS